LILSQSQLPKPAGHFWSWKPAAPSAEARHTTTPAPPAKVIAKANLFGHKVG